MPSDLGKPLFPKFALISDDKNIISNYKKLLIKANFNIADESSTSATIDKLAYDTHKKQELINSWRRSAARTVAPVDITQLLDNN